MAGLGSGGLMHKNVGYNGVHGNLPIGLDAMVIPAVCFGRSSQCEENGFVETQISFAFENKYRNRRGAPACHERGKIGQK